MDGRGSVIKYKLMSVSPFPGGWEILLSKKEEDFL